MPRHKDLTGTDLHEPKGVATAANQSVYKADGAGSGDWEPEIYTISSYITDISTASTTYIPIPFKGNVVKVITVIDGAIATADATLDVKDLDGNSMGTITVAFSGSAAGDVDTLTPSANEDVTNNDYITIETDGASTNTVRVEVVVVVERN